MNKLCLIAVFGVVLGTAGPALAQDDEDNTPPVIMDVVWEIARNYSGEPGSFSDPEFGFEERVLFDPASEMAHELDRIYITLEIYDPDFTGEEDEGVYYLNQTIWLPFPGYPAPVPPPVSDDRSEFFPEEEGLTPAAGTTLFVTFRFQVPSFSGENQAKLRGLIDHDVAWFLHIMVSNEQDPGCTSLGAGYLGRPCDDAVDVWDQVFVATKNPVLLPPNPPPFADAGADRTVPTGVEILLDGSRTYDAFNQGFNVGSVDVFAKDTLTYTWEWMSGPVRVDPTHEDQTDPIATVILNVPNDPSDPNNLYYEYRLTVDDNVNALPSMDSVRLTVVDELPEANPPVAIIEGPAGARPVRSTLTLVSRSYDPDRPDDPNGLLLNYRWQQTNELGGSLDPDELQSTYQPLGGMTGKTATWQALTAGTFYFRLLVDDGDFRSSAQFSVEVIDTETGGVMENADGTPADGSTSADNGAQQQNLPAPAGCGAGALPLAVAPLVLCLLGRRR